MEVFKILGRIAVSNEDANEKIEETGDKAEKTSKKMSSVFGNIGKFALKAAKVAVVATTAVATGIAGITAKTVSEYADYEQLAGGVETLFKDSSDKVVEYANNAYKTAGLSANEYMDTVTSFSASLLQGLGGDTEKAAETANLAITDMSDNANKMGTDMSSIQDAYQGFAKQNYTMLDNLKLGYGGTASEMARLINDSGVLGDTMTVTADNVNSVSFDKMIEAIHVVQTNMDITGTTAKEAATTIQGSIGMVKSAWTNLLIGMADPSQDMGVLMNNLVDSAMAVADNLVPRIADTLPRVVTGLSQLAQKLAPYIPPLIEQLLPSLIQGATSLLSEVVNNLPGILETLLPGIGGELGQSISTALNSVFSTLTSILPSILQLVGPVLTALSTLLDLLLPPMMQIIQTILPPLTNLINMLLPPVTQIIQSLLPVLMAILQPILELLQPFLDMLTPIIDLVMQVVTPLTDLINMILPPLVELLSMLMEDYLNVLKPILEWYCKMLSGTLKAAIKLIVTVINNCKESFTAAWRGIKKAWNAAPEFFSNIWSNIKSAFSAVGTWFSDIFGKAWSGIKNAFSPMVNFFSNTWQKIKDIFGKVGTAIADGLKGAVTSAVNAILSKATGIINGFIRAINSAISILNKIPKVSISRIDELDAPQLAEGGVLKRGQVGILEGNGAEAVVPLEKNTGWIKKVAEDMAEATGGAVTGDSESLKVLYKILEIIRHIDDNMYEWILTALTEGVRLKLDGREFGRMVRNA
nr:MAG TPA: tail tape measure protein [Bacteriophage sp.]